MSQKSSRGLAHGFAPEMLFADEARLAATNDQKPLEWIETTRNNPYFTTETGASWTPIGQNDAITWIDLNGLFRRRDLASVETYFEMLARHKVACLRLMLEYCHGENRYFERPVGHFPPNMIRLWDDVFALCEKHGLRVLLTPYDTFWMWIRWKHHPYNKINGGSCNKRSEWLLCRETRAAIKNRLAFAAERWGNSGALFAWDVWNEIHPAHANDSAECFDDFVSDIADFLRRTEMRLFGRTHPQTVSVFGPALAKDERIAECVFRHPSLDFANVHFYESGTIDNPKNTVDAAVSVGRLTRQALEEIRDNRPFFDSEHGPIHAFKDRHKTLPELFDDEYFRHIQWAHFASGGAGGGMRWANRHPHRLTAGMRRAQAALAAFLPLIDWQRFRRRNLNQEISSSDPAFAIFGCGDDEQVIVWLLRKNKVGRDGLLRRDVEVCSPSVAIPDLRAGHYRITMFDTANGIVAGANTIFHRGAEPLRVIAPQIQIDLALAVRRVRA